MKNVRLVAADLDHTLLTEKGQLPDGFTEYINRLNACGIHFIAASGRPIYTLLDMFSHTADQMSFISDNGALIKVGQEAIFKSLIPVEEYQEMISFVVDNNIGVPTLCGLDGLYTDKKYQCYEPVFRRFFSHINYVDDLKKVTVESNKFTVYYPEYNAKDYLRDVFSPRYGSRYHTTIGGDEWIDIMNTGINKGSAIEKLADHFGIGIEQTMAFGDTYNDIEMLQTANFSYVMKNAAPEMKQYGKYEADTNDNFGVLKVLDELLQLQE